MKSREKVWFLWQLRYNVFEVWGFVPISRTIYWFGASLTKVVVKMLTAFLVPIFFEHREIFIEEKMASCISCAFPCWNHRYILIVIPSIHFSNDYLHSILIIIHDSDKSIVTDNLIFVLFCSFRFYLNWLRIFSKFLIESGIAEYMNYMRKAKIPHKSLPLGTFMVFVLPFNVIESFWCESYLSKS